LKFLTWLNIVALLIPKGKRNRENKLNLNEGTILCLLDKPPHDKPDFLLSMNGKNIGIEHTDARPENETCKDVLRRKEGIGLSVYLATPVEPNEPSRKAKQLRKEISSNEPGAGWGDQDGIDRDWVDVMLYFINKKEKKLNAPDFSRFDQNWLLIRDAWPFPSVNLPNAIMHLSSQIVPRNIKL